MVIFHRQRASAHERLLVELGVFTRSHRDWSWGVIRYVERVDIPSGDPRIPLHRHGSAIWQIILTDGVGQRARGASSTFTAAHVADAHGRIAVPTERNEDVFRDAAGHSHRRALQRRD